MKFSNMNILLLFFILINIWSCQESKFSGGTTAVRSKNLNIKNSHDSNVGNGEVKILNPSPIPSPTIPPTIFPLCNADEVSMIPSDPLDKIHLTSIGVPLNTPNRIEVTTTKDCLWELKTNFLWINFISSPLGKGNGTVLYSVLTCEDKLIRVGKISLFGNNLKEPFQNITIQQEGISPPQENKAPVVNIGVDRNLVVGDDGTVEAEFESFVIDDELPITKKQLNYKWDFTSNFANINNAENGDSIEFIEGSDLKPKAKIIFNKIGDYALTLTVNDSEKNSSHGVVVRVSKNILPPAPPQVSLSGDEKVRIPDSFNLIGAASNQRDASSPLTITWNIQNTSNENLNVNDILSDMDLKNINRNLSKVAKFSTPGEFKITLTVDDGQLENSATHVVKVLPANLRPNIQIEHIQDTNSQLPHKNGVIEWPKQTQAILLGTVTDPDQFPLEVPEIHWSIPFQTVDISLSPMIEVIDDNLLNPQITFKAPGSYVFRLTAFDGLLSNFEDINLLVTETVVPNNVPKVEIVPLDVVNLDSLNKVKTIDLDAQVTDDGLPKPHLLTSKWSVISGPLIGNPPKIAAEISNSSDIKSLITFKRSGTYSLKLQVSDKSPPDFNNFQNFGEDSILVDVEDDSKIFCTVTLSGIQTPQGNELKVDSKGFTNFTQVVTLRNDKDTGDCIWNITADQSWIKVMNNIKKVTLPPKSNTSVQVKIDEYTAILATNNKVRNGKLTVESIISSPVNISSKQILTNNDVKTLSLIQLPPLSNIQPTIELSHSAIVNNTFTLSGLITDDGLPSVDNLKYSWASDRLAELTFKDGISPKLIKSGEKIETSVTIKKDSFGEFSVELIGNDGDLRNSKKIVVLQEQVNSCPQGQTAINGVCACPAGAPLQANGKCEANVTCTGGKVRVVSTNTCACPASAPLQANGKCEANANCSNTEMRNVQTNTCECKKGFKLIKGQCVVEEPCSCSTDPSEHTIIKSKDNYVSSITIKGSCTYRTYNRSSGPGGIINSIRSAIKGRIGIEQEMGAEDSGLNLIMSTGQDAYKDIDKKPGKMYNVEFINNDDGSVGCAVTFR